MEKNIGPIPILVFLCSAGAILNLSYSNKVKTATTAIMPSDKYSIADVGLNSCIDYCKIFLKNGDNSSLSLGLRIKELENQLNRFKTLVGVQYFKSVDLMPVMTIIEEIEKRNSNVDTNAIRELLK